MSAFCNSPGEQGVPVARRVGGWDSAVKGVEEVEIQEGSSRGPVTDDLQTLRSPDLASTSPTSLRIALESSPVLSLHHLGLEWHGIQQPVVCRWIFGGLPILCSSWSGAEERGKCAAVRLVQTLDKPGRSMKHDE